MKPNDPLASSKEDPPPAEKDPRTLSSEIDQPREDQTSILQAILTVREFLSKHKGIVEGRVSLSVKEVKGLTEVSINPAKRLKDEPSEPFQRKRSISHCPLKSNEDLQLPIFDKKSFDKSETVINLPQKEPLKTGVFKQDCSGRVSFVTETVDDSAITLKVKQNSSEEPQPSKSGTVIFDPASQDAIFSLFIALKRKEALTKVPEASSFSSSQEAEEALSSILRERAEISEILEALKLLGVGGVPKSVISCCEIGEDSEMTHLVAAPVFFSQENIGPYDTNTDPCLLDLEEKGESGHQNQMRKKAKSHSNLALGKHVIRIE